MKKQCKGITGKGKPCSRMLTTVSDYCPQHRPQEFTQKKEVVIPEKLGIVSRPMNFPYMKQQPKNSYANEIYFEKVFVTPPTYTQVFTSNLDVNCQIMMHLDFDDVINLSYVSKSVSAIAFDEKFWKMFFVKHFGRNGFARIIAKIGTARKAFLSFFINFDCTKFKEFNIEPAAKPFLKKIFVRLARKLLRMSQKDRIIALYGKTLELKENQSDLFALNNKICKILGACVKWTKDVYKSDLITTFAFCSYAGLTNYKNGWRNEFIANYMKIHIPHFPYFADSGTSTDLCSEYGVKLIGHNFELNRVKPEKSYTEINDYFRGLFALNSHLLEVCEPRYSVEIMKARGRTYDCIDYCYPCYSCGFLDPNDQVLQNVLESSDRMETFDDLLKAMKIEIDGWLKKFNEEHKNEPTNEVDPETSYETTDDEESY